MGGDSSYATLCSIDTFYFYPKTAHRDMDLHNNEVGREIGEKNKEASESEMADIIYQEIYSATTSFIWLHE